MARSRLGRAWTVALLGAVVLVGCGVSGGEPSSSGGAAPGGGSSGAGSTMTIEQAGARYEELVAPANCSGATFIQTAAGFEATTPMVEVETTLRPLAVEAADAYEAFGSGMDAEAWPSEAEAAAASVAQRAHDQADAYRAVADAPDTQSFRVALDDLADLERQPRPSGGLRAVLGLEGSQRFADFRC